MASLGSSWRNKWPWMFAAAEPTFTNSRNFGAKTQKKNLSKIFTDYGRSETNKNVTFFCASSFKNPISQSFLTARDAAIEK